jgi:HD-like signal output (HDOD) protein
LTGHADGISARPRDPRSGPGPLDLADPRTELLRRSTESVLTLPTLPESVRRLLSMVDEPSTSARELARAISSDQVLTARVLKLANSSYYGFSQRVGTVSLALMMLGFQAVKDLALTTSVMRSFGKTAADPRFDIHLFWSHAAAVGAASRHLARLLRVGAPGEAFTAGILHDIGQVVLHEHHAEAFHEALERARAGTQPMVEAEIEILGAGHARIGGWLCARWNLPDGICQAVAAHHGPFSGGRSQGLGAIVALADHLAWSVAPGQGGAVPELDPDLLPTLSALGTNVDAADFPALRDMVQSEIERSADLAEAFR